MSIKGNLKTFFLSSLLQLLSSDKKTGTLHLTRGRDQARIVFKNGTIVAASSNRAAHRLGALLQAQHQIDEETLQTCAARAEESGTLLGQILLEQGVIDIDGLNRVIRTQVEQIIYTAFLWDDAEFSYADELFFPNGLILTEVDTIEVILEASRRIDEISVFRKLLPSPQIVFQLTDLDHPSGHLSLNADEKPILALINGRRSISRLIDDSGYDDFSAYKSLYALLTAGLIEPVEEQPAEQEPAADPLPDPAITAPESGNEHPVVDTPAATPARATRRALYLAGLGVGLGLLSAGIFLLLRAEPQPDPAMPVTTPAAAAPTPAVRQFAPAPSLAPPTTTPRPQPRLVRYRSPAAGFNLQLPPGFRIVTEARSRQAPTLIHYEPNVTLQITTPAASDPWDAETAMYRHILSLTAENEDRITIDSYQLLAVNDATGYEIQLDSRGNDSDQKIAIIALERGDRAVRATLRCAHWLSPGVLEQYHLVRQSLAATLAFE